MTHPGHVPFRVEFEQRARDFLRSLTPRHYGQAMTAVHDLVEDPHPDDRTRIWLPLPFRFGAIGYTANGFFITYGIETYGIEDAGDSAGVHDWVGRPRPLELAPSARLALACLRG